MNKIRRKQLSDIMDKIAEVQELLESVRDEEQEAMDNMPESLQASERYTTMSDAVESMDLALYSLQEAADNIECAIG